jgi:hypothetical protein
VQTGHREILGGAVRYGVANVATLPAHQLAAEPYGGHNRTAHGRELPGRFQTVTNPVLSAKPVWVKTARLEIGSGVVIGLEHVEPVDGAGRLDLAKPFNWLDARQNRIGLATIQKIIEETISKLAGPARFTKTFLVEAMSQKKEVGIGGAIITPETVVDPKSKSRVAAITAAHLVKLPRVLNEAFTSTSSRVCYDAATHLLALVGDPNFGEIIAQALVQLRA